MVHITIFIIQRNWKLKIWNPKGWINEIDEQNSKDVDRVDDDRRSSTGNIAYSACFVCEKGRLDYSQYGSTKYENLVRCGLSNGEVNLKRTVMNNLELDDSSLVAAQKGWKHKW